MKVIVACELSGTVRDAFIARGHDAISCDLEPSDRPGPHIQGDIREVDLSAFDLMIAHPPCTDLAVSGARYFKEKGSKQAQALAFVRFLLEAPVPRTALENPISVISSRLREPDQIIQPYQFGEDASKATCLWLQNLPKLRETKFVPPHYACLCGMRFPGELGKYGCPNCAGTSIAKAVYSNQTVSGQNRLGPSETRAKERSKTYEGIAAAMADQWGSLPPRADIFADV